MKRSLLCIALFAGAFIALDETAAIEIVIDDTKIELVVPAGYCPLDRKDWPESRPIDFTSDGIKKQGERLAYFVDSAAAKTLGTLSTIKRHWSSGTKMSREQC